MSMVDRPKILIVDDDTAILESLSAGLTKSGYHVDIASNGESAIRRAETGDLSMVIADVRLKGVSGLDLLEALKAGNGEVPVVLMTAQGSVSGAIDAMKRGASDYLMKPFSFEMLDHAVRRVLEGASVDRTVGNAVQADRKALFVTHSPGLLNMLETARKLARSSATVLILGESGTGKECLARYIHRHSSAPDAPYIAVNCAALPESLAESELFGYEKGAFTGALARKAGKFELAGSGTLVLDEISEMPLALQSKLLRVLQEREIDRVGGGQPVPLKARIIAVSNVDLEGALTAGTFRQDLFYRINVVPLVLPPLSRRTEDIPVLVEHFLQKYAERYERPMRQADDRVLEILTKRPWAGNVRELENTVERAVLLYDDPILRSEHVQPSTTAPVERDGVAVQPGMSVREMERHLILNTLAEVNQNRSQAAEMLGISIRTLRNKLKEYREAAKVSAL